MAQAAGRGKFGDVHPSPDYIAGFVHYANGVHGVIECGAGAPDVPEADAWWRKCRIGAQGTDGFAEVLTGGGWRAVTKTGSSSGPGSMNYDLDMPPYIQDIAGLARRHARAPVQFRQRLPGLRDHDGLLPLGRRGRPDRPAAHGARRRTGAAHARGGGSKSAAGHGRAARRNIRRRESSGIGGRALGLRPGDRPASTRLTLRGSQSVRRQRDRLVLESGDNTDGSRTVIEAVQTFLQDLRYASRAMVTMRGAAVAAVLTLALGIGATTTMFSVVYAVLLRPLPFAHADGLAMVFTTQMTRRDGLVRLRWSWPRFLELQKSTTSFETMAAHTAPLVAVSGGEGEPEQIDAEVVSPEYFRVLRVTPIAGRLFDADESSPATARPVAMVGARLWRHRFGADPALVGRTVRVNDVPLTVVGILPDGFAGLSGKSELWIPPPMAARLSYAEYLTTPQNFISVVARLKDGVSLVQANAELAAIGSRLAPAAGVESPPGAAWSVVAVALDDLRADPAGEAIGARADRGGGLCPLDRVCERREPVSGPRAGAAPRDGSPPGDRVEQTAPDSTTADGRAPDGRPRGRRGNGARRVGHPRAGAYGARHHSKRQDRLPHSLHDSAARRSTSACSSSRC